jgi:hypothetical protein
MEHVDPAVVKRSDTRSGCPCRFCMQLDPQFPKRRPMDQIVASNREHKASAHITEDGYVRHRVIELSLIRAKTSPAA